MKLFDVYPLFDVNIVKGQGCKVWDDKGQEYLDLYGGHAVISIGHSHPHYIQKVTEQLQKIGFYSKSVINTLQQQLAERLGKISGYEDYQLFLINSGLGSTRIPSSTPCNSNWQSVWARSAGTRTTNCS